ncbi:unnamed protein product [Sphagnum jensenii]|uniref:Cytochrome c oxidase assembly protein n=1 Tax=Sphagnum jensenii TaxID=128206 RepID=A0ABP1AHP5_9BRYO
MLIDFLLSFFCWLQLRLESARRVQEAWRLSMLAHSFHPTGGYCRHAAHSRTVSSSDVQLNKQIWGAAGHYFGSFSLPRTQGGNVLFSPTRRFHTEPHIWRLISQQRMSIELPLALRTRRSVADGMVVGTISMKVGRATLRTQARVVTEAGKAEVSRGAKLTMEIRRLGENKSQAMLMYLVAMVAAMVGITYAAVPLYRKFCQATGYGGTIQRRETVEEKIARHKAEESAGVRELVVQFNADVADGMPWKFTPSQREVHVRPGQSTLAFYTAENKSETPITGVSTYNVTPMKAGIYFNKIQCFCFEEQRLLPGEKIDMPVFFYIDPEFATDPKMDNINSLILSYTFFKVEDTPTQS